MNEQYSIQHIVHTCASDAFEFEWHLIALCQIVRASWCETTRPRRSLLNSVLTHTHSHSQTLIYINKLNVHSMPSDCIRSCIWMRTHMCMDGYLYAHTHRTMWGVAWTGIGYPGNHIIGGQAWLGLWSCIGIGVGHDCIDSISNGNVSALAWSLRHWVMSILSHMIWLLVCRCLRCCLFQLCVWVINV